MKIWNIENELGYTPITTFYTDFGIAESFGEGAIKDTFKRGFADVKNQYKYLTEFVMVLNHKIWEHYENGNEKLAKLYNDLWETADIYACENLKGEELDYFYSTTD